LSRGFRIDSKILTNSNYFIEERYTEFAYQIIKLNIPVNVISLNKLKSLLIFNYSVELVLFPNLGKKL